jgi:hypothetical protein
MKKKTQIEKDAEQFEPPRKANECIGNEKNIFRPSPLFDEFWREGELALFFGAPGAGKSLLAMQLADAMARGRGLEGFRMPAGRRKVLYVDLLLTNAQFQARYSHFPPGSNYAKSYKFAENLFRGRPPANVDLVKWLRSMISDGRFQIVIIDDISAIKRTHDGTRETLSLMRRLKELRDELGVSILVLADSEEPGRSGVAEEHDLRRSRVLCSVADSVFAIGRSVRRPDDLYLIQTRSQNAPIFWTAQNAPTARIKRLDAGLLGLEFDERFAPYIDDEKLELICRVHAMHDAGGSYRVIAQRLNISRSQAARLYKKWTPDMGESEEEFEAQTETHAHAAPDDIDAEDDYDDSDEEYLREVGIIPSNTFGCAPDAPEDALNADAASGDAEYPQSAIEDVPSSFEHISNNFDQAPHAAVHAPEDAAEVERRETDFTQLPFATGPRRRSVYDLEVARNAYDHEIFVEEWNISGRPNIWYEFTRQGVLTKSIRGTAGIMVSTLGKTHFV